MPGQVTAGVLLWLTTACTAASGPYAQLGINGYIDPNTWRHCDPRASQALLNPIFRGWAAAVVEYAPSDQTWSGNWNDPAKALGPVTGSNADVVSLGELTQQEILQGVLPGIITLAFGDANDPADDGVIRNARGYDFVVFENGMISQFTTGMGSLQGQLLAELAYVEVSSNGVDFARFPAVSLTPAGTGAYGTTDMNNILNLAGKHPNGYGICTGTPFDLAELADHPDVLAGKVELNAIRYVRLVDVPGNGSFLDDALQQVEPNTGPQWRNYTESHPIYDQWPTWGSGGFDLEAVGVLHEQQYAGDINLDGIVDYYDLSLLAAAWQSQFGQERWNDRCDLATPQDHVIDSRDFAVFAAQWKCVEEWRTQFGVTRRS
jgi:hypothetical protein